MKAEKQINYYTIDNIYALSNTERAGVQIQKEKL